MTLSAPIDAALIDPPETIAAPFALQCMDIWGGNEPVVNTISVPGLDVSVLARPHDGGGAGGDLYHVSLCGSGRISRYVLADVAGHGVGVSEVALRLRRLLRRHINTANQSRFARQVNAEFEKIATGGRFATAVLMTYFAPSEHLIVCNAGHPSPLWYRADRREWSLLSHANEDALTARGSQVGIRNLPLGVLEPTDFHQFAVPLGRGDIVLSYTDAMIESTAADGTMLGERGLLELASTIAEPKPESVVSSLMDRVMELRGGAPLDDDATILSLHHNAAKPERQSMAERLRVLRKLIGF